MSETTTKLGEILYGDHDPDAIHIAVAPVTAGGPYLTAGTYLKFLHPDDTNIVVEAKKGDEWIGIVDPFLFPGNHYLSPEIGQKFWMLLKPGSITTLKHEWTHPAFEKAKQVQVPNDPHTKSERAIREFLATTDGPSYDEFIATCQADGKHYSTYIGDIDDNDGYGGDYGHMYLDADAFHSIGVDAHGEIPPGIWDHVELIIGKKLRNKPEYFSCSC